MLAERRARLRRSNFSKFQILFYFPNSNVNQNKFKHCFKHTFQNDHFWEVSKTELLQTFETLFNFSNSLLFFFSFISKPFSNSFSKAFWIHFEFWIQPLIAIDQMHRHVCTSMLLLLIMNFNLMKFLFPYISWAHKIPK